MAIQVRPLETPLEGIYAALGLSFPAVMGNVLGTISAKIAEFTSTFTELLWNTSSVETQEKEIPLDQLPNRTVPILRGEWGMVRADGDKVGMRAGSFGPSFVVTFTRGEWAAMAHIDSKRNVNTISDIFNEFKRNGLQLKDVDVSIFGGDVSATSILLGKEITKKIKEAGFQNLNKSQMFISNPNGSSHFGASVDARNGKVVVFDNVENRDETIDRCQEEEINALEAQFGKHAEGFPLIRRDF